MNENEKPRILATIALDEEYEIFLEKFPPIHDSSTTTQFLFEHESGNDSIRLFSVLSNKMGAKSSALAVDVAVQKFKPHAVVVIGIAGGITDDVKIGDVCVSNEIIDVLNNNKFSERDEETKLRFSPDFYMVDAEYITSFRFLKVHPELKPIYNKWQVDTKENENLIGIINEEIQYSLHIGPIVCGPVSASNAFNEKLKDINRKVIAIETESGGVFGWCEQAKIPSIAIRGISDMADRNKNSVETSNSGKFRTLAMQNAISLLKRQMENVKFFDFLKKKSDEGEDIGEKFDLTSDIVPRLDNEIKIRLREVCSSFSSKSDTFYFPLPRVQKFVSGANSADGNINQPEGVLEALKENRNIFVRIPRTFSGINLGIYLSYYLIRNQIGDKQILPILIDGKDVSPPRKSFNKLSPNYLKDDNINYELFEKVYIIEEPDFSSRTKNEFLKNQIIESTNFVVILSKIEDKAGTLDSFLSDTNTIEYTTKRISFSETAIFLEKTFDMTPSKAESVAIRLENTFRKFRIEVDPSYFTLIQEDTLIALINANKRAELIQFAVQGLLSLIVAYDPTSLNLSRTTLERFLSRICKYKIENKFSYIKDTDLAKISSEFLHEYGYEIDQSEFISPFFKFGLLHNLGGNVYFSHPYLESYLIACSLKENDSLAQEYFNPELENFDIYSFDLYCEMGPSENVIDSVCDYSDFYTNLSIELYGDQNVFFHKKTDLNSIINTLNMADVSKNINKIADKLQKADSTKNVRVEKQRILDTQNHVISGLNQRKKDDDENLEENVQEEFYILDGLSRASVITLTLIGSGSESINKNSKERIIKSCLDCNDKFANIWTINRLKIDFKKFKEEILSYDNIKKFMNESDFDEEMFSKIKKEIGVFVSYFQTNLIMEPISRIMNNICSLAGVLVLSPIIFSCKESDGLKDVLKAVWLMESNPKKGYESIKQVFSNYNGSSVVRVSVSHLLLNRLYWLHYQNVDSHYFSNAAKRIIGPTGLNYGVKTIENAMKGVDPKGDSN
ncbi:phosphorylase family protein [Gluconobacter wancherniae]|uniref:Nucleoside phosphorylase domain-containing protein n=1 Tax=Gluconobacter wancherniae NBRC 103581 TaxID=656744 RepID=A0A511B4U4_9PROT|nr:hypothetical protein [Gluconobacter wancherniae]MBF0854845.1 hypothetical protein [Gluconobacter wancherniae]GBD57987.1 hypothetical protein NBRC103581_02588 [Gluconobacter wancherniae NBRC 103581]GBR65671.1 hypothetical protein AA103581_1949 [Gluconobacter wancherniae NBRC 103581]GEK94723.1 hypothetical protein GWA01_24930 [Gluconobacter wancherniae NBRC 103581]